MKRFKTLKGLLIFGAIEGISYWHYDPENLEMFLFVWVFIFAALVVFRWVQGGASPLSMLGLSDQDRYSGAANSFNEIRYGESRRTYRRSDTYNLSFIVMLSINVIMMILYYLLT
ncbi:hypothetical protein KHM83_16370 [Fusibacter paucivorans]|uniref:DUF3899 domain-containing protein n=1 Tax=Fusibacter paucivorans TaxID=76009 RepID=A0ABS5PSW9_9FIRM|nr:hypothetical protein [Fusibacter paucivorans]MBS7528265.1 hypothetical protein [Fusibacter paucivorans]